MAIVKREELSNLKLSNLFLNIYIYYFHTKIEILQNLVKFNINY